MTDFKIQYTDKKFKYGYIGMNAYAAKHLKIPFNYKKPKSKIVIYRHLPKDVRVNTIRHERIEAYLMKNKHYSYPRAHKIALKFEELSRTFPEEQVLKKMKKLGFKLS